MSRFLIILLGLVALSILARFCIYTNTPRIEDDIATRTQQALTNSGKSFALVGVDGRDIYLSGIAPNVREKNLAADIAGKVFGVRSVVNQLDLDKIKEDEFEAQVPDVEENAEVVEAEPIEAYMAEEPQPAILFPVAESPYRTDFSYKSGAITLTGVVADEVSHLWLLNKAKETFGEDNVEDQLRVSYGAPQGWHNTVETALANLVMFSKGQASMVDNTLTLSGTTASEELVERVKADVAEGIGQTYIARFDIKISESVLEPIVAEPQAAPVVTKTSELKVPCQRQFNEALAGKRILFDTNKAAIKLRSHGLLDQLVTIAKGCAEFSVEVGGHTDSRGLRAYNQRLSESRAKAVVAYLKKHGINANKLSAKGYGELMPIADNNTVKGMARNRRIEFKVEGK